MASSVIIGVLMLVCAVSAASTVRERRGSECICTREMWPVCGVDGNNYDNMCELECAGVDLDFEGPCENSRKKRALCKCPKIMKPVCGTNRVTYDNECKMACDGVDLDFVGSCKQPRTKRGSDKKVCACPRILRRVCGKDGVTYDNKCDMECNGVDLDFVGSCKQPRTKRGSEDTGKKECACPKIFIPMCGKDGETYANRCDMACNDAEFAYFGQC